MESILIFGTAVMRILAAWFAFRLFRRRREWRFAAVTFVLSVSALFPILSVVAPPQDFVSEWLPNAASGMAVLLTAVILVRTLTDLGSAYEQVREANDALEHRVAERTSELRRANESLLNEVEERRRVEAALRESEQALRGSEAELRKLAGKLIAAQEEERRRLARELHDDLSQTLAALALEIAALDKKSHESPDQIKPGLQRVEAAVHKLAESIHDMSRLLHPSILDDLGLEPAMRAECERFSEREGVPVDFKSFDIPEDLPGDSALSLYRITQEALHNIAKHADAKSATVRLTCDDGELHLTIEDQGKGFDVAQARQQVGLGLVSMSERAQLQGGRLTIESTPGKGSVVDAVMPLVRDSDE